MNALPFTPSKVTVNMDPVDLSAGEPESGQRAIEWMVRTDDATVGPVSIDLIERGLNLGKVPETAEVAPAGSDAWRPVREIIPEEAPEPSDEQPDETPVVAAKVVPVGPPVFEWPESFAPKTPAPEQVAQPAQEPPSQQPPGSFAGSFAALQQRQQQQQVVQRQAQLQMQQQTYPQPQQPYRQQQLPANVPAEEPITIPTEGLSPAVKAFGVTLAVSALVAAGVAIIQAL